MTAIKEAAAEFLGHQRVAVTGVSREPKGHGSNVVYKRLRERGYEVFAVNPNADKVEGDHCLPRPALDPRRRRGGRDRNTARDRGGDDARVRRARDQARVDASRPWPRQRLEDREHVRAGAWHHRHRWRLSVHVRPDRRLRAQGDAVRFHLERQRAEGRLTGSRRPSGGREPCEQIDQRAIRLPRPCGPREEGDPSARGVLIHLPPGCDSSVRLSIEEAPG